MRILLGCILLFFSTLALAEENQSFFITLADIHFNPFSSCMSGKKCPFIDELNQLPIEEWAMRFAKLNTPMPYYGQDTNYTLLKEALIDAKTQAQLIHPQFVIVLGDFLAHDFRRNYLKYAKNNSTQMYQQFVFKTIAFLTQQLKQTFPNIPAYYVVGNNDSYQGNYVVSVDGKFFQDVSRLWNQASLNHAGYYSTNLTSKLRLIVLNSTLFSSSERGKNLGIAASEQLQWLNAQLKNATTEKQKVIIAMHIPTGMTLFPSLGLINLFHLWKQNYIDLYNIILTNYDSQIIAVLVGHLHTNWEQVIKNGETAMLFSGTPAISPIYGTTPGFNIYSLKNTTVSTTKSQTLQF